MRKYWSVGASYVFYGAWSWKFALLMLLTTSVDFFTARWIDGATDPRLRRWWLTLSMLVNLGTLGIFKYFDFFAGSVNGLLGRPLVPLLHAVLPIGISFYTFESMSYTIDVYRRQVPALRRFIDYAHFVTMFPRLVSGPIVRYADVAEQLSDIPPRLPLEQAAEAARFFVLGLAKKMLIADSIARSLVSPLFADVGHLHFFSGWAAALGYTAQLYFDFSGYSDMAVGLGLLLGFRFPRNFHLPYRAPDIAEFWRRWHISLSSWLRDYLYIPLGGNRQGPARTSVNLFLTMLLGGLWHGANWTFVLWGAYHGLALLIYRQIGGGRRLPRALAVFCTFVVVVVGWVIFRADSLGQAAQVLAAMGGVRGFDPTWLLPNTVALIWLAYALLLAFTGDTYEYETPLRRRWAVIYGLLLAICVGRLTQASPFLYFQF